MLRILAAVLPFLSRRNTGRIGRGGALTSRRGGMALGTIASIAAPFVIKKLMARRQQRAAAY